MASTGLAYTISLTPPPARMSTSDVVDYTKFSVASLLAKRTAIDEAIMSLSAGVVPAPRGKKGKKAAAATPAPAAAAAPKAKRESGSWAAWTKKICLEHAEEKAAVLAEAAVKRKAAKAAGEKEPKECKGPHMKWLSANYGKTSEGYLAFKAEFDLAHPKGSEASSEAGDSEASEAEAGEQMAAPAAAAVAAPAAAKKRGAPKLDDMTPEQRAKHDAGVAERKAKKAANKVVDAMIANAPLQVAPVPLPLMVGGGSSSAAAALVPEPVTTAAAAAEDSEEEADIELKSFSMDGQNYIRPWNNTSNSWATGDLWYTNKKGEKTAYWGELMEDGSVNADAEEPPLE